MKIDTRENEHFLKLDGMTIIIIEQKLSKIGEICDLG